MSASDAAAVRLRPALLLHETRPPPPPVPLFLHHAASRVCLVACSSPHPRLASPRPQTKEKKAKNVMRGIKVEKLILNISTGQSGDRLTFASRGASRRRCRRLQAARGAGAAASPPGAPRVHASPHRLTAPQCWSS